MDVEPRSGIAQGKQEYTRRLAGDEATAVIGERSNDFRKLPKLLLGRFAAWPIGDGNKDFTASCAPQTSVKARFTIAHHGGTSLWRHGSHRVWTPPRPLPDRLDSRRRCRRWQPRAIHRVGNHPMSVGRITGRRDRKALRQT